MRRHLPSYQLPYAVLMTRVPAAYMTKTMATLRKSLADKGIPVFENAMIEREAFKAMFTYQRPLEALDPTEVTGVEKAKQNASQLAGELLSRLQPAAGEGAN